MNKIQEIIDDFGNWNVVNIDLISLDKKKQQVEWTFKLRQFYLVGSIVH